MTAAPDDERWRPVRGYAGWYEVSDLGRVYSLPRAATAGGLLAVQLNSRGYRVVMLSKYGRRRTVTVARLVLEAFREPGNGRRARHGPKGSTDDSLANLSWSPSLIELRLCVTLFRSGSSWLVLCRFLTLNGTGARWPSRPGCRGDRSTPS